MRGRTVPALPAGSLSVNGFSFFNAVSFQIVLGAPVVLYAKSLGASSFVLGVIAGFTPLLTILQFVAARLLHRTGYRRLVLMGWGTRTVFTFVIATLPLWPGLNEGQRLWCLLAALFAFNVLRGFASGAWLPWITAIVPENVRGRFLSRDQSFMHLGCFCALVVSSLMSSGQPGPGNYAMVFGVGAVAALVSLWFIRRIPEGSSVEEMRRSAVRVPWLAMVRYAPFARLLVFSLAYSAVIGGVGVFTVEFLAVKEKFGGDTIFFLGAMTFVGALAGLALAGPWLDETGSKPWMARALLLFEFTVIGWILLAGGLWPAWKSVVGALNLLGGVAGAIFGVASTRIVMVSVPVMGRNHFFALYTVLSGIALGLSPMIWGAALDALRSFDIVISSFHINRYTIYFTAVLLLAFWVRWLATRLHEGGGGTSLKGIESVEA
jgi:MFS family permease